MARTSRLKRAYLKQKKTRVDEIRLRDLNKEGQDRAMSAVYAARVRDVLGPFDNVEPVQYPDTDSQFANWKRKLLGLDECDVKSSREEILARVNHMVDTAELVFRLGDKAMFLIRDGNYFYFLYREKGNYYKKSVFYDSRIKAMDRYNRERIIWMRFYKE